MGGMSSGQKGTANCANKSTDAKLHNAVLKTLCVPSQQVREVRGAVFMCWMIKQEAPEYKKPKEQLRACSELAATKGKGHCLGPPGMAAFTGLLQALSERGSTGDDLEPEGAFDLVPHGKLAKVYDPALSRLGQTGANRLLGQAPRGAFGTGTVSSDRTELKKVTFVAASRPDSPIRPRLRQVDWRQGFASDKELTLIDWTVAYLG